jgi:hypothetical protein
MGIVIGLAPSSSLFTSLENSLCRPARGASAAASRMCVRPADHVAEQLALTGRRSRRTDHRHGVTHALRYVMLVGVLLCLACIWPALWGRRTGARRRA